MKTEETISFEILHSLSSEDEADLKKLVAELDSTAVFDGEAVRDAVESGLISVYVYRYGSRIAASTTVVRFRTPTGLHHRIEDVIVNPTLRGGGIGRKMMLHVLDQLRESGAVSVELTSRPAREAANALYRSLGFIQRETNVYQYKFDQQ